MKLLEAIVQTAKEWGEAMSNFAKDTFTKSNIRALSWVIWIVIPPLLVASYIWWVFWGDKTLVVGITVVWFITELFWASFWIDVERNIGTTYISHYDEEKKRWVKDYEENKK